MRIVKRIEQDACSYIFLDTSDLKDTRFKNPDVEYLLKFRNDTYDATRANASEVAWEGVFKPVHGFIDTLTQEELAEYAGTLAVMNAMITEVMVANPDVKATMSSEELTAQLSHKLMKLEDALSKELCNFTVKLNLYPRLLAFADSGAIPIQSFNNVGERAQDSAEMTWYRNDIVKLIAVVILCKMFAPVFSAFMSCFKLNGKDSLDGNYKEFHCVTILRDTLGREEYHELTNKLEFYLRRIIKQVLSKDNDPTHVVNGLTFDAVYQLIYSVIMVRRLVLVDLYKPDSNLATYMTSCARTAAKVQYSRNNCKTNVCVLNYPNDAMTSEDGNLSNLEVESRTSSRTADYSLIITGASRQAFDNLITTYNYDRAVIDSIITYYSEYSHVDLTVFNNYLLGIAFGKNLCGARSIEMLEPVELAKLISLLQYYLAIQGYDELAIALTAKNENAHRERITGEESVLRAMWNSSQEYQNCASKFPIEIGGFAWYTGLHDSVMLFTNYDHTIQVAPVIWDVLKEEPRNGDLLILSEDFAKSVCVFIEQHTQG